MILLTVDEIIELHKRITIATGGASGIRDKGLLESAVLNCYQSFDGIALYPTIIEKAARMAYSISKNHPFVDGNKRIAVTSMLVLLRMNEILLRYAQEDLIALGLGVADGTIDYKGIVHWIRRYVLKEVGHM